MPMPLGKDGKPTGMAYLSWNDDSNECKSLTRKTYRDDKQGVCLEHQISVPTWFAKVALPPGADVLLDNLTNGNHAAIQVPADGKFTLAVQSDKFDKMRVRVQTGGINVADVHDVIETAVGGKVATEIYEGEIGRAHV